VQYLIGLGKSGTPCAKKRNNIYYHFVNNKYSLTQGMKEFNIAYIHLEQNKL